MQKLDYLEGMYQNMLAKYQVISTYRKTKVRVLAFWAVECPLRQYYSLPSENAFGYTPVKLQGKMHRDRRAEA